MASSTKRKWQHQHPVSKLNNSLVVVKLGMLFRSLLIMFKPSQTTSKLFATLLLIMPGSAYTCEKAQDENKQIVDLFELSLQELLNIKVTGLLFVILAFPWLPSPITHLN